jgi:hypothetical protein
MFRAEFYNLCEQFRFTEAVKRLDDMNVSDIETEAYNDRQTYK